MRDILAESLFFGDPATDSDTFLSLLHRRDKLLESAPFKGPVRIGPLKPVPQPEPVYVWDWRDGFKAKT